jgi:hypothetical protein
MDRAKNILGLILIVVLSACQPAPATSVSTPDELAPYYGSPEPIKIIIDGKTYNSEIGTTKWIREVQPGGIRVAEIGDAFAIITPKEPIVTTSDFSLTLKLPIPINPTELWYAVFAVPEDEINSQDPKEDVYRWQPNYEQQPSLQLLVEQQFKFSLEPGFYVLEVHAGWGGTPPHTELEADYGFLLEVQM